MLQPFFLMWILTPRNKFLTKSFFQLFTIFICTWNIFLMNITDCFLLRFCWHQIMIWSLCKINVSPPSIIIEVSSSKLFQKGLEEHWQFRWTSFFIFSVFVGLASVGLKEDPQSSLWWLIWKWITSLSLSIFTCQFSSQSPHQGCQRSQDKAFLCWLYAVQYTWLWSLSGCYLGPNWVSVPWISLHLNRFEIWLGYIAQLWIIYFDRSYNIEKTAQFSFW